MSPKVKKVRHAGDEQYLLDHLLVNDLKNVIFYSNLWNVNVILTLKSGRKTLKL